MQAFSAVAANLLQPPPSTSSAPSSREGSNGDFATQLQSATKQQQTNSVKATENDIHTQKYPHPHTQQQSVSQADELKTGQEQAGEEHNTAMVAETMSTPEGQSTIPVQHSIPATDALAEDMIATTPGQSAIPVQHSMPATDALAEDMIATTPGQSAIPVQHSMPAMDALAEDMIATTPGQSAIPVQHSMPAMDALAEDMIATTPGQSAIPVQHSMPAMDALAEDMIATTPGQSAIPVQHSMPAMDALAEDMIATTPGQSAIPVQHSIPAMDALTEDMIATTPGQSAIPVQHSIPAMDALAEDMIVTTPGQSAIPVQPIQSEAPVLSPELATELMAVETNTSFVGRMLDAITAPAINNGKRTMQALSAPEANAVKDGMTTKSGQQGIVVEIQSLTGTNPQQLNTVAAPTPAAAVSTVPTNDNLAQSSTMPTTAQKTAQSAASTLVFRPGTDALFTTGVDNETTLPPTVKELGPPLVVQNKYGQIITIQQNSAIPRVPEAKRDTTASIPQADKGANLDLTNQYIHSHLPNETATKGDEAGTPPGKNNNSPQTTINNQTTQNADIQAMPEELLVVKNLVFINQESQPLNFSLHQGSSLISSTLTTSSTTTTSTTDNSLYRLGSGTFVPDGTVVDQMIAHFPINKRLENGSVNLKLHPQELGELRLEIKVEQDNVKTHIVTQSLHAQEMIDRHIPRLRAALEQQGLHLHQVEVTVATNDNAAGERFQDHNSWQQSGRSTTTRNSHTLFNQEELDEELGVADAALDNTLSVIA